MSFSTHFALSNFEAGPGAAFGASAPTDGLSFEKALTFGGIAFGGSSAVEAVGEDDGAGDSLEAAATLVVSTGAEGEEKKDVIEALDFGFLVALVAKSAALRLRGVAIRTRKCEISKLRQRAQL